MNAEGSRTRIVTMCLAIALAACGDPPQPGSDAMADSGPLDARAPFDAPIGEPAPLPEGGYDAPSDLGVNDAGTSTLAAMHPCDRDLGSDPAVIWFEDFEEGSVSAITSRYENVNNPGGMSLVNDVPTNGCGASSLRLVSGVAHTATDLFKRFADQDEVYVRWYVKYDANVQWHHSGVWFGGYNPASNWPNPQAGLRPNGDDRFSIAIEPVHGVGTASARFDTYDYWMGMHSWMSGTPMGDTAYYGNSVIHRNDFTIDEGRWVCLEVHARLNTDLGSSGGGMLEVWKNDVLVQHFDESAPLGCWIRDKFCPEGADGAECTDYPSLCGTPHVPLDQQYRSTSALRFNAFWPQNYVTEGPDGGLQFDQMVVATQRIGCTR